METDFDCIVDCLAGKEKDKFTGSIKFAVEFGKLVAITESNRIDGFDTPPAELPADCGGYAGIIGKNLNKDFCGSYTFVFERGAARKYSYVSSLKSETLRKFLKEKRGCRSVKIVAVK